LAVCLFGGLSGSVCAHEYEDGFVERSLTITIRDGVGYGEYQIGLNANTAAQVLKLAEQLRQQARLASATQQQSSAAGETATAVEASTDPLVELNPVVDKPDAVSKVDVTPRAVPPKEESPKEESPKEESPKEESPKVVPNQSVGTGVGEHLTDLAMIKRFGELQRQWFAGRLKLACNGQQVALSKVSIEPAARHPFSVVVKFQFSVEAKQAIDEQGKADNKKAAGATSKPDSSQGSVVDFQVTDGLFSGHHGATRYALRSRGSTMVLQSNVAPALVRADRVEVVLGAGANEDEKPPEIQAKLLVGRR